MGFIGTSFPKLESWLRAFSIELFANVLLPTWIEDALSDHQGQSVRVRKLPSDPRVVVIKMSSYPKKWKSA